MKIALAASLLLSCATSTLALDYEAQRANTVRRCEAISPSEYQSGLFFNPAGYRSYYVRSECFQRAAIQFRDTPLCTKVIQRHSLFASSWGYSQGQCRKLVAEGIAADGRELEQKKTKYALDPIQLRDFRIERNGNGRDFDIVPILGGSSGGSYILRFEILQSNSAKEAVSLHSSGYYLDGNSNLRIFIRQEDIRKRFAGFSLYHTYTVQGTLIFDVGNGTPSGYWSDSFVEGLFPEKQRRQFFIKQIRF